MPNLPPLVVEVVKLGEEVVSGRGVILRPDELVGQSLPFLHRHSEDLVPLAPRMPALLGAEGCRAAPEAVRKSSEALMPHMVLGKHVKRKEGQATGKRVLRLRGVRAGVGHRPEKAEGRSKGDLPPLRRRGGLAQGGGDPGKCLEQAMPNRGGEVELA